MSTKQKGMLDTFLRPDEHTKFKRHILWTKIVKKAMVIFRYATLIGISYIVLSPMISIISKAFFSDSDVYNSMVYVIPQEPTLHNFSLAMQRMNYFETLGLTMLFIRMASSCTAAIMMNRFISVTSVWTDLCLQTEALRQDL